MKPETVDYLQRQLNTLQATIPTLQTKLHDADYLMSFGTSTVQDYCVTQKVIQWIEYVLENQDVIDNGGLVNLYKSRILRIVQSDPTYKFGAIDRKIISICQIIGELEGIDMIELTPNVLTFS